MILFKRHPDLAGEYGISHGPIAATKWAGAVVLHRFFGSTLARGSTQLAPSCKIVDGIASGGGAASRGVWHGWPGPGSHEPCRPKDQLWQTLRLLVLVVAH